MCGVSSFEQLHETHPLSSPRFEGGEPIPPAAMPFPRALAGEELRDRQMRSVPVVVLTAARDALRSAQEVGAAGFLGKPFDMSSLCSVVDPHVGGQSDAMSQSAGRSLRVREDVSNRRDETSAARGAVLVRRRAGARHAV